MSEIDWDHIKSEFGKEFRPEEIGTAPSSKGGAKYVDARSIAERLDAVVGPGAWEAKPYLIDPATGAIECVLKVHGVARSDIGYPNEFNGFKPLPTPEEQETALAGMKEKWQKDKYRERIAKQTYLHPLTGQPCLKVGNEEPLKAASSDAFKRAAVMWGIGRYLYPYASKSPRAATDDEPGDHTTGDGRSVNPQTGEIKDRPASGPVANTPTNGNRPPTEAEKRAGSKPATEAEKKAAKNMIGEAAAALNTEGVDVLTRALRELKIDAHGKGWDGLTTNDCMELTTWGRKEKEKAKAAAG